MRRACMSKNREVSCYLLTKMSWKGNYKRLFTIGTLGVTTYNKDTLRVTNQWTYEEIYEIKIDHNIKSNQPQLKRFILDILDTNRKRHELTFATEYRVELLTDLLHFRDRFIKEKKSNVRIHATKISWSESTYDVILDIGPISIDVRNPRTGELWKTYDFKDIECISKIHDTSNGVAIIHGGFGHIHIFLTREPDNLIKEINKSAHSNLSVSFNQPSNPLTRDYCTEYRLGKVNQDHLISQAEFTVQKLSNRYGGTNQMKTVSRLMCLTESLLLERDPTSYRPISAHPLCEIHLLVRDRFQPQRFSIEYVRGQIATYFSTNRDALLASLLDGVRASGNRDVYVSSSFSDRSLRFIPLMNSATEEVESVHLRFLRQRPEGVSFWEVVQRFNANIAYSGLLHAVTQDGVFAENKEKLIKDALISILTQDTRIIDANPLTSIRRSSSSSLHCTTDSITTSTTNNNTNYELILIEAQFHALRRLVASKAGFNAFTQLPGIRVTLGQLVVNALKLRDDAVTHSVLDAINTLMHPMHDQPDIRQEQLNKASIMSSEIFLAHLVDIFTLHALRGSGSLVLCALLDFFTYGVCLPYSETSEGGLFDNLLRLLANRGRALFRLYLHPSLAIVRGGGMIMRALIEEGGTDVAKELRSLALTEGALLHHFWTACFTQGNDPRSLAVQQLSRQLVALWSENNQDAWDLFKRMLPLGLLSYLESTEEPPVKVINMLPDRDNLQLAHIGKQNHLKEAEERPVVLRRPRHLLQSLRGDSANCKPTINWRLFFYQFQQDHAKADLIWTIRTRNELRESMEKELQEFRQERNYFAQSRLEESDIPDFDRSEPASLVSWNYREFKVNYPSLIEEPRVGNYFLRLLLEEDRHVNEVIDATTLTNANSNHVLSMGLSRIRDSTAFFNELFRRYLQYVASDPFYSINDNSIKRCTTDHNNITPNTLRRLTMRCLCLHAMSVVYHRCHHEIGPITDIPLLTYLLDRTTFASERDCLLLLLDKLMLNKNNVMSFVDADGVRVLIDLACLAHLHTNRAPTPFQSNVLKASSEQEFSGSGANTQREWWYINTTQTEQTTSGSIAKSGSHSIQGPVSFNEVDHTEQMNEKTIACGMYGWMPAKRIVQIRWTLADISEMNVSTHYTSLAIKCIDILRRLCDSCSSRDLHGGVVRPLPKPRRAISDMNCLPHLIQLLLTFDPPLVERVVSLLHAVMDQNPLLPRLYLTGIFYFILLYTGSNVLPIAKFLKDVHLLQALRLDEVRIDLTSRSILGNMLPDAMIAYLENHPPEKFAEIFLGDFDSPEAIWNSEMRRYMISRITSHLADFTPRLHSNIRAIYRFIGMPIIIYPQLENELFCHNYYLRHLCDLQRFPNWPIRDPVALLRDILKTWRDELQKKPVNMSYEEALGELGLDPTLLNSSNEESFIRRAYYQMSMKYHPDKNPNGREKFQSLTKAYQFLCNRSKLSRGPNRLHIQLMLRAQSIVYKRYRSLLISEKYAGYPMLVATILAEISDDKLFSYGAQTSEDQTDNTDNTTNNNSQSSASNNKNKSNETVENAVLLVAATELTYETVVTSVLNAEELRRENGIPVLQKAFSQCSNFLSRTSSRPGHIVVEVCGHIVSVLAAASLFPSSRQCIQETPQLLKDTLRLLYYKNLPKLCCLTATCVASFCIDYWLCVTCYEYGGLFLLLQHVLSYDFTLEEAGVEINEETNSQVLANRLALLSLWAIGRMVNGYATGREVTEDGYLMREGPDVMEALSRLLTPHLARKILELNIYDSSQIGRLSNGNNDSQILHDFPLDTSRGKYLRSLAKLLTTNSVTPYLIWDNRCRAELETLIDLQVVRLIKTGECNLNSVLSFTHESYAQELLIGEVFVRLYNKQPAYTLDDPKGFIIDLFQFLTNELQNLNSEKVYDTNHQLTNNITNQCVTNVSSALEALTNVIRHNTGLEIQCIGHFPLLFSILDLHDHPEVQLRALDVIQAVSTNPQCLEDMAASHLLTSLVMLFFVLPRAHLVLIQTMEHLISSSLLLKEFIYAGGLIYLMSIICQSSQQQTRQATVDLISHCLINKQFGRRIQAILNQYLPNVFVDTIRDQPETFLALFDADHENPEVIWDSNLRSILTKVLNEQTHSFYNSQCDNHNMKWNLSDSFKVPYTEIIAKKANEENKNKPNEIAQYVACLGPIQIANVYLHLYISHPGWTLRNPELFLNECMEKWIEAIHQLPNSTLLVRLLTRACKTVLTDRPGLTDSLPRSGNVHRVLELLAKVDDPEGAKAIVIILHQMSASKLCVQSMSESDTISGLIRIVNRCIGEELGLIGETLFCLFDTQYSDPLIEQALKHDLIGFILRMLQNGFPSSVREPGQTRAYLIKALKAMQYSAVYGAKVTSILETYPNWADYRDQGHSLFISNVPQSMTTYLTAGPASGSLHSGYLTTTSPELNPSSLSKPYS
ncbi:endosomal trafficking protein, putative [Schistosoma mansoni]|uniref:endosomal trafficking protein, putative n=1 Tax=Schistosoma mansoni TaxID=6183 RepID=UPI0001A628E9|nr:endosomal trafficking protein, putative [Schistosoma mansoni]|eukprot:XP_018647306.1 endosomal trafficking protein, putative [Schistosoma mansoni]